MATLIGQDNRPADMTSRLVQHNLLSKLQTHRIWRAATIAAGFSIAIAVLVVAWFTLLALVYHSFSRILY